MRILPILIALPILIFAAPAFAASVEGSIEWDIPEPPPAPRPGVWASPNPFVTRTPCDPCWPLAIGVEREGDPLAPLPGKRMLTIEALRFSTEILPLRAGDTLAVVNRSAYPMTLSILDESGAAYAEMPLAKGGGEGELPIQKPGVYTVAVKEFSHMKTLLLVTEFGRYISIEKNKKIFNINNLTPGDYGVRLWASQFLDGDRFSVSEQRAPVELMVRVVAKQTRVVRFSARVKSRPAPEPPPVAMPEIPPAPPIAPQTAVSAPPKAAPKPKAVEAPTPPPIRSKKVKKAADDTPEKKKRPETEPKEPEKEKAPEKKPAGGLFKIKVLD